MRTANKKIFICITKSNWGGAQKYVFDISRELIKRKDINLSVFLGGNGDLKTKLEEIGVKTINTNSERDISIFKDIKTFFELFKLFKKEKPDIIHLNSSKIGLLGALAGRLCGIKKIIFTAHGWVFNEDRNFIEKKFFYLLQKATVLLSHKTIAVSDVVRRQIKINKKKIVVINNGIQDIDLLSKDLARESLLIKIFSKKPDIIDKISNKTIWIGTISELHKNKGLEYVIEAVSKLKENIILVIIGEGEERKKLEENIVKYGASNKIFILGKIENASSFLRAFDLFTLTSITEALPYVLLEAGKAKVPVVTSDVGGIPEIIENEKTGLLTKPKNVEDIKEKILNIIKDPKKANILATNLNKKIDRDFKTENMIKNTFEVFNI
jgi:glycosyltransferase involved in cell wall biosynthesis